MAGTNQLGMQMHVLCYLGKIVGFLENQRNPGDTAEKWDEKPKKNSALKTCKTIASWSFLKSNFATNNDKLFLIALF